MNTPITPDTPITPTPQTHPTQCVGCVWVWWYKMSAESCIDTSFYADINERH